VDTERFRNAIAAIDAANAEDPNTIRVRGVERQKELCHAELVSAWVRRLRPQASEALLLAARAHQVEQHGVDAEVDLARLADAAPRHGGLDEDAGRHRLVCRPQWLGRRLRRLHPVGFPVALAQDEVVQRNEGHERQDYEHDRHHDPPRFGYHALWQGQGHQTRERLRQASLLHHNHLRFDSGERGGTADAEDFNAALEVIRDATGEFRANTEDRRR